MSTASTDAILKTVANRIRSYTTPAGVGPNTHSAKVYLWFPAPDAAMPQVVLSKTASTSDPEFHHLRETFLVEALIRGRARMDEPAVNALADVVQSAFPTWCDATAGLLLPLGLQRGPVEYVTDEKDQEIIELRLAIECAAWPTLSTALT